MFDHKAKAAELVAKMTLEEKVSQMLHGAAAIERLGVPSYNWWNEALHGVARSGTATMFPQALAMAATFDEALIKKVAEVISDEGRAKYIAYQEEGDHDIYKGLTFWSPNINIFRDPRWGRGHETYGEDPYLTSRLGVTYINGLQGDDPEVLKTAACAKHFAVHSGPEAERHEFNAVVNDYDLWNTYLPAFEVAVKEANVEIVMGAYNRTNGEPCCGSQFLLVDILREKWGFDGHVTSDCWAIKDFNENHKVTATPVESVALAVSKGCDLNCGNLYGYCLAAVREGLLSEEDVTNSVIRLITTRMRLGLLGAPENKKYTSIPYEVVDCQEHRDLNLEVAKRSIVLLKNDGVLPLKGIKTIGVIGPNADSRRALEGNYEGTASDYVTPLQGIRELANENGIRVMYAQGCHLYKAKTSILPLEDNRLREALSVAKRSDAVVLCLGLDADIEGEEGDRGNEFASGDKLDLRLVGRQQMLLERVTEAANGKPIIVVLIAGSALDVSWADTHVNAILQAFYPGSQGGRAIAEVLFGRYSPSGKLPVTFYRSTSELPDFHDYNMENRTYRYYKGEALYPFGFGLGYSKFELLGLEIKDGIITATAKNNGTFKANETVQLYVQIEGTKENWNLCGIRNLYLKPSESVNIEIPLDDKMFSRYNDEGDLVMQDGKCTLYLGFTQPDKRSAALYGQAPLEIAVPDEYYRGLNAR